MTDKIDATFADFALLAVDGTVLEDGAGFLRPCSPAARLRLVDVARRNPTATSYEVVEQACGGLMVVGVAPLDVAQRWLATPPTGPSRPRPQAIAVSRMSPAGIRKRISEFGEAFGLTPAVVRVVIALYEQGEVASAAEAAGVSFNTARKYLNDARAAIWAPNLPRLVTWAGIGSLATDSSGESDHAVGTLFSLSERQRRLAGLVADGASRVKAAEALGISDAVAKKQLAVVFTATGVVNAIGLARLFAELRGLAILARATQPEEPYPPPPCRNLVIEAANGRRVFVSDYGPEGGKPVVVLHNTMNCRGVDRALLGALQDHGYRPLSPDRPGYGDTDPAPPNSSKEDYLRVCVDDVAALCERMGWRKVQIIAHGPVHVVLALLRHRPDLIEHAVIDAPEPDSAWGAKAHGMIPSLKRQFSRRPWAVASVVRILGALVSLERISGFMREWTVDSPADQAAMQNPDLMMDFYRKLLPFKRGQIDGFVREQVLQATSGKPAPVRGGPPLTFVIGRTDFMHDASETLDYWRSVLPGARYVVLEDAGRFVSYSHPGRLVEELRVMERQAPGRAPSPRIAGHEVDGAR